MKTSNQKIAWNLNLHGFFKSISSSFIALFVPLIVFEHTTYTNTILYLFFNMLSISVANLCFYKLIKKKPLFCIGLNFVLMIGSYLTISLCNLEPWLIILIAILNGFSNGLYYPSMTRIICCNKSESNFAYFQIFKVVGIICITIINGLLLNLKASFSIWLTSLISAIFFIFSYIPILLIKDIIKIDNDSQQQISLKEAFKKTKQYQPFNALFGLQDFIVAIIFPLFLMMNDLNFDAIVYIVVLINIFKIISNLIANQLYQKNKSMVCIIIGAIMFGISCLVVAINRNVVILYIFSIIPSITFPFFYLTTFKKYSIKSQEFISQSITIRESLVHAVRLILIIPMFFIDNFSFAIYSGVLVAILMIFAAIPFFKKENDNIPKNLVTVNDSQNKDKIEKN